MDKAIQNIKKYVRAVNYLTVTQIYLQDNYLLDRPLHPNDIKQKLFGHWGTCPGINFVYGNVNHLIKKHKQSAVFVLGPGHGMPGLQANLFLEGTLGKYYPKATMDEKGIAYISKMFAWPYGFSSHCSPETPGLILEGGELGYSLSSAYGAVMDNPDLLAICLIGDGEAETGAIASGWHLNKLIDPAGNGAVLPILHVNGYKISGPTIFGRMSDTELHSLFSGYGYEPIIVSGNHIYEDMYLALEKSYSMITSLQKKARSGSVDFVPKFPMIILKSPKGWTTIPEIKGQKIEGTIRAHQVVMPGVKTDETELSALEQWMRSYHFEELFDRKSGWDKDVLSIIPDEKLCMGDNPSMFGLLHKKLLLPDVKKLKKNVTVLGQNNANAMRMAGVYLREIFTLNEKNNNFRLMSPDETYSNRLDDVFDVTSRGFVWPIVKSDLHIARDGRVMEMLSEHNMHGLAQGYVLTGRHAVFTTYEAFAQIFSSMAHMYQKFLKYVRKMPWRQDIPSMNYLLTSTAWRQEHNGYSHQNPSFVSGMLEKHSDFVKAYYPVDDNSMLAVMEEIMSSVNQMNIVTAGKTPEPRWLTYAQAKKAVKTGLQTWDFVSDDNPDIVLVGIGDYVTNEALSAIALLKKDIPKIRIRFVNIIRLQGYCDCPGKKHPQLPDAEKYFTLDKPVLINFHGYPEVIQSMLFHVKNTDRFSVHGYVEEGGTTTPFDMQVRNKTDRYHLAIEVLETLSRRNVITEKERSMCAGKYAETLKHHQQYIRKYGTDPDYIADWKWNQTLPEIDKSIINYDEVLRHAKTIAFVGLSDKEQRDSHRVAKYFQEKGYRIIPINPYVPHVLGEKSYKTLADVPKEVHIDIVDIFRKSSEIQKHLEEIVEIGGIQTVWLAEGVTTRKTEDFAQDYGLNLVTNYCILEAHKKLTVK